MDSPQKKLEIMDNLDDGPFFQYYFQSPIGCLMIVGDEKNILNIEVAKVKRSNPPILKAAPHVQNCVRQLGEYFWGRRRNFQLPIKLSGTPFQENVWKELQLIPFGKVRTYGEIARRLNRENSCRAVGGACNRNRLIIVVPCHRVVGANGKLGGFCPGGDLKRWLLDHESGSELIP